MKGLHGFSFIPLEENEVTVDVFYKDTEEHVIGSPYTLNITGPKPWARVTNVDHDDCAYNFLDFFVFVLGFFCFCVSTKSVKAQRKLISNFTSRSRPVRTSIFRI